MKIGIMLNRANTVVLSEVESDTTEVGVPGRVSSVPRKNQAKLRWIIYIYLILHPRSSAGYAVKLTD